MDIYCSQLGMMTQLTYCLSMNEGLPCRNVIGCWEARIDIMALLKGAFTEEELRKCFSGLPKSRLDRIMEILRAIDKEK